MTDIKITGLSRVADNEQCLLVSLSRKPTDDELRAIHDHLGEFTPFDWAALQHLRRANG